MTTPLLNEQQMRAIARAYDGKTETIDKLVKQYGVRRHNIVTYAKRGGYVPRSGRIDWTEEKDQYLRDNWGKVHPREIYEHLQCSASSVFNRLKRIGHSTRDNTDLTIYDLEHLLKLDHRIWRRFIDCGWLKSYEEFGRSGKTWSRRVKLEWLHAFLREHPDVVNYRSVARSAQHILELQTLPDPPKFMRITCRSDSWRDGVKATPVGRKIHHGEIQLEQKRHTHSLKSCSAIGGTDVWAPIYTGANCPRCGCLVSRFSEKAIFTDDEPDDADSLNAIAGKLGLVWREGRFWTARGRVVSEEELLRFVFSTKRNAGKAFAAFRRLLQAGVSVAPARVIATGRMLPNMLDYELRVGQEQVFREFEKCGSIGVYWPPGIGKMYLLAMIYTRLAGEHFLFVHSRTVRDAWIEFFRTHAPRVKATGYYKDTSAGRQQKFHRIDIYDRAGELRSVVRIYNYRTRADLTKAKPVVVGYDEAQFLPGNSASRLSLIASEFRVGLSATPFREDGRADMIQLMTGAAFGESWQEFRDTGQIHDVPVRVVIVKDLEHKYRALGRALNDRRTIIFSDAIDCGKRISAELGVPFLHGESEGRLAAIARNKVICMSRVGDCGLDITDLEEVIEFNFHHGSRAQSLQRLGRLLHSRKPLRHTVLMTIKEFSLYHKRLTALEQKGFTIRIVMDRDLKRRGRPRKPQPVNEWARILGVVPAAPARSMFTKSHAEKTARVIERLDRRAALPLKEAA